MAGKKAGRRKPGTQRPIFDSIRKPLAPPGHPLSHAKPEEKANPAGRKAKYKQKPDTVEQDDVE